MKLKKMLSILLISSSLLAISPSAFADSAEPATAQPSGTITPYVSGLGDTRNNAITLMNMQEYSLYIDSAQDEDWYKWTNNTGVAQLVTTGVLNLGPQNSLQISSIVQYTDGRETTMLYAEPTIVGNNSKQSNMRNLYVPDGATVYLRINANKFAAIEQYKFNFSFYP
ncbi:hypothetical protein RJP21_26815 [Paenibacillus sp. VCA1]|uniref:hypothetical protein n=1 Tax=Paenibacillus sp. VCA1 TaxID=3039148 RepID=UPI002870B8CA|nr:hypothetical protein [Paenibacillus sp. VCA1]MDR9857215.1 hypothetical protein [Paenibacillus sp. VCA1]